MIKILASKCQLPESKVFYRNFRDGDVRHSLADINKAQTLLGYEPKFDILSGLDMTMPWYISKFK
jgi:UDP-N-acetylglucosamine 4-epimerase